MSIFGRLRSSLPPRQPAFSFPKTIIRHASGRRDTIDPKMEIIRNALYPSNIRNTPTPTGTWRPDTIRALRKAIPSIQAHEIIERAFKLYIRHKRQRRQAELQRKFESMRRAMAELEQVDAQRAYEANRLDDPRVRTEAELALLKTLRGPEKALVEGRIPGLFPREMRIPTETPSADGWNHDWKPPTMKRA